MVGVPVPAVVVLADAAAAPSVELIGGDDDVTSRKSCIGEHSRSGTSYKG